LGNFIIISLSVLLLLSCSARINENRVHFDGILFNAKLKVGANKKDFEIIVPRSDRSLVGAKEAGRYEATIYCVNKFGTSDIIWDVSPDDVSKVTPNKSLFIKGRCRI
tara:strand:- start:410 stop:733 length:324 start_codon:yes stop_codon:yes gene_type:complete